MQTNIMNSAAKVRARFRQWQANVRRDLQNAADVIRQITGLVHEILSGFVVLGYTILSESLKLIKEFWLLFVISTPCILIIISGLLIGGTLGIILLLVAIIPAAGVFLSIKMGKSTGDLSGQSKQPEISRNQTYLYIGIFDMIIILLYLIYTFASSR